MLWRSSGSGCFSARLGPVLPLLGPAGAVCRLHDWPRSRPVSSREYQRDISGDLLVVAVNGVDGRCGQLPLADLHLLVEMRELPASVLEEESAIDCERCGKEIHKEDHKEEEDWSAVLRG